MLTAAWNSQAISTLPRVCSAIQVNSTVSAMVWSANAGKSFQ